MANGTNHTINVDFDYKLVAAMTPAWFHYLIGVILLLCTIASVLSNGSVLTVMLFTDRRLLVRTNYYITTICMLNFVMGVFGAPMVISACFEKVWIFGSIGCKYYGFIMSFGGLSTIALLCTISVDRYIYVVRHDMARYIGPAQNIFAIVVCLLISLGFALAPLLGWNRYTYEGVGTSCAMDLIGTVNNGRSFVLTLLVIFFMAPLIIMSYSYGAVYTKVVKERKAHLRSAYNRDDISVRSMANKLTFEKELAITVTIIIGLFLLCYSPFAILLLWKVTNTDSNIDPIIMAVPQLLTKIGGIFTPIVFLSRNKSILARITGIFTRNSSERDDRNRQSTLTHGQENGTRLTTAKEFQSSSRQENQPRNQKESSERKSSLGNKIHVLKNKISPAKIAHNEHKI